MRESEVEGTAVTWAEENGFIALKLSGPNDRGKPDRLFLINDKAIFIEFKATGEEPTALQWRWLKELRKKGFVAEWYDHPFNAIRLLKKYL